MKDRINVKKPLQPKQSRSGAPEPMPPDAPVPADQMNSDAKEAQPRQPDGPAGWSVGGASPEWGPLDLTGGGGNLPAPGNYDALISDVKLTDKPDVLWMIVHFQLVGCEVSPEPMFALLQSRNGPSDRHRLADGMRVVRRLAAATLTPLATIQAIEDLSELPRLFVGKPVSLTIAHRPRDGVNELVARVIRPR